MSKPPDALPQDVDQLRKLRDELRLKMSLARADARDAFEALEKSWHHLEAKLGVLGDATREAGAEVREAAKLLIEEIRDGYQRVKKLL